MTKVGCSTEQNAFSIGGKRRGGRKEGRWRGYVADEERTGGVFVCPVRVRIVAELQLGHASPYLMGFLCLTRADVRSLPSLPLPHPSLEHVYGPIWKSRRPRFILRSTDVPNCMSLDFYENSIARKRQIDKFD